MKIRFIINPIAGTGKQKSIEEIIQSKVRFEHEICITQKKGDAEQWSNEAKNEGIDVVVAVGGDGTVNECAKALVYSNTALGVLPCGSGNGFALHFGMNKKMEKAIEQINKSQYTLIDTCSINNEVFVNVSGIGFDAFIANRFAQLKKRGFANYLRLIMDNATAYKAEEYTIETNDKIIKTKAYIIAFANASQYGNNFKISPNADFTDGKIDLVLVKEFQKWKIPYLLYQLVNGKVNQSKNVEIIQCEKAKITTNNYLVHLDGEPKLLNGPLTINVLPKSLKIFFPNETK